MRSLGGFFMCFVTVSSLTPGASGQEEGASSYPCDRQGRHVTVEFEGGWSKAQETAILSDLGAALRGQETSACSGDGSSGAPAAALTISLLENDGVRIDVADRLTNKRVSRDILLPEREDSSSALVVAVAADELLRATWAELSMRREPEVEDEPAVPSSAPRATPPLGLPVHRLGVSASTDVFVQGTSFFGGDLHYGSRIRDLEWSLSVGPRLSSEGDASPFGGTRARALSTQLSVVWPLVRGQRFLLGPVASVQGMLAQFQGTEGNVGPSDQVRTSDATGFSISLRAGLMGRFQFERFYVGLVTQWGGAVRGFEVTDGEEVIGGMRGYVWSSGLNLGAAWGN